MNIVAKFCQPENFGVQPPSLRVPHPESGPARTLPQDAQHFISEHLKVVRQETRNRARGKVTSPYTAPPILTIRLEKISRL